MSTTSQLSGYHAGSPSARQEQQQQQQGLKKMSLLDDNLVANLRLSLD